MAQYTFNDHKAGRRYVDANGQVSPSCMPDGHQFDIYEGWIGQCTVPTKDPVWAAPEGPEPTPCVKHYQGVAINYHLDDDFDAAWDVFGSMAEAEAAMVAYVKELLTND